MVRRNLAVAHLPGRLAAADIIYLLRFQRPSRVFLK